ncbi:MAG: hypothetical protein GF347_00105 [Candidatus Moranbacteria bacterium]|nr:hypothetical protein [Candidatus Moranbacteria bacterium]
MYILEYLKRSRGILGMNSRNLEYIRPYNKVGAKKIADNKILSKKILEKNKIGVSKLISVIKNYDDAKNFDWDSLPNSFVLKPNRGLGGEGIMVIYGRKKNGNWVKANREEVTGEDLKNHVLNILEGSYSLAGVVDHAFFEERVKILKLFKPYSFRGIPDIRIIVFNSVPVMAMLRLPTKQSGGRANIHLGGVCIGIDMNTGVTTTAITKNLTTQQEYLIDYLEGTRHTLSGIKIPFWNEILKMSIKAQQITKIGFLGIDIMIDRDQGPVVAELNCRSGLAIQIANLAPLKTRLKKVEGLKVKSAQKGIRLGRDLFGGEIEEDVEDITGKKILAIFESVILRNPKKKIERATKAKIDTGAFSTSISTSLAVSLGYEEIVEKFEKFIQEKITDITPREAEQKAREMEAEYMEEFEDLAGITHVVSSHGISIRPKIKITIEIAGKKIETSANITKRKDLKCKVIIGRKDIKKDFIVDPSKITKNNL